MEVMSGIGTAVLLEKVFLLAAAACAVPANAAVAQIKSARTTAALTLYLPWP
jgi:hypothetical protein